jgi:hypothetical protein
VGVDLLGDRIAGFWLAMVAWTDRFAVSPTNALDEQTGAFLPRRPSSAKRRGRPQRREHADLDTNPEWCLSGQHPPAHYRAIVARARRLQSEATTSGLKQYLEATIAQSEQLAGNSEETGAGRAPRQAQID